MTLLTLAPDCRSEGSYVVPNEAQAAAAGTVSTTGNAAKMHNFDISDGSAKAVMQAIGKQIDANPHQPSSQEARGLGAASP